MKIFGINLVKNEADIIEYSLTESSKWADKIIVYDNGSTDGTWEIVQRLAKINDAIIPWKSESVPFHDGLRAKAYNEFKHLANKGDWWCRLDSDEFYIDNPKDILKKVSKFHHVVTSLHFEYKLTHEDISEYTFSNRFPEDRNNLKYYAQKVTSETRFIRHRHRLKWSENMGYPKRRGIFSPIKIRIQHYQYRSPNQIKTRLKVRRQATEDGYKHFGRDNVTNWKDKLQYRSELIEESSEFKIGWIQDTNVIPWYWKYFRIIMHFFKVYP